LLEESSNKSGGFVRTMDGRGETDVGDRLSTKNIEELWSPPAAEGKEHRDLIAAFQHVKSLEVGAVEIDR
jgi:hypothetical protein